MPRNILKAGSEFMAALCETSDSRLLRDLFRARTAVADRWLAPDEGSGYGIFSDMADSGCDGAALIPEAVSIALEQDDPDRFASALSLLYECVELSKTKDKPFFLARHWKALKAKAEAFNTYDTRWLWGDLERWYGR